MNRITRREAVKTFVLGAAFSNIIGQSWSAPLVYQVRALSDFENAGWLELKLADFPELQSARGSIRIGTSPIVRHPVEGGTTREEPAGLFQPVIINRGDSDDFYVMSAECQHESCTVRRMDAAAKIMTCPCHGSQYAMNGAVVHGPAMNGLQTLRFTRTPESLRIEMPGVFYEITAERITPQARVAIKFIGFQAITYQVFFRASLASEPVPVSFALTLDGAATQTEVPGVDEYVTVYLERPGQFGFFEVAMKTESV